ncbi:hypothetical protein F5B22DRAFT_398592 [Xylaria bambusicola]|uniref:uncharacterized protein n=1 Tax=Xylaria bambusicola TaxID=326684 RepID=UPI0020079BB4|nr:uncharacterized protein F5B22DRAFT_398592 [Xylaria bambusicola]KAI0508468.1 hypothetical protein F5B22DRAFT_398592 [Xylaria bambusicola]
MAELIGIIGSSIAFIELAAKISACIFTIKSRLNEIKNVSNKLEGMMREVEILEPIVEALSKEFCENSNDLFPWNDDTTYLGIRYCEKALGELNIVLGDLPNEVDVRQKLRRYKATMKAIYKGDILDRCHMRLQSAVHFLSLTQQWYIITLLKAQPRLISQYYTPPTRLVSWSESSDSCSTSTVSKNHELSSKNCQGIGKAATTRVMKKESVIPTYSNLWSFGPLGSVAWRYYQDGANANLKDFDCVARVQANYWFASRVWDIQASRATTGWTIKLNAYCIQPDAAPVFSCARRGDMAGILRLIDQGRASLQDHTPGGQSLLHLAAEHGQLPLFKTLVLSGLDYFEVDHTFKVKPCETMVTAVSRYQVDVAAMHDLYLEYDIYVVGGLLIHPKESVYFYEAATDAPPELVKTIVPAVLPGFYEKLSLEERVQYCSLHNPDGYAETLELLINPRGSINKDDISTLQQKSTCLLTLLAFRYGPMSMGGSVSQARLWRKLARRVIRMTEDLSYQTLGLNPAFQTREFINKGLQANPVLEFLQRKQPLTPLFTALSYFRYEEQDHVTPACIRDFKKRIHTTLMWWLEDLASCRVNLLEYGRRERRHFLRNNKLKQARYHCARRIYDEKDPKEAFEETVRLINIDYGAEPLDWKLHWDVETERYAGDFWRVVENASSEY